MARKFSLTVIVGPTASGKSDLALHLAKKYNGEIISADSRQVYRGLDIGSAKIKGGWKYNTFIYKRIPHFCIDMVPPARVYTAAEFKACAQHAIADISSRGKMPIVAGGTAFWVDALVYDLDLPEVPPNQTLRKQLEKKSVTQLFAILKKLDPRRAARIEQKNPRRLIRAIEIAKALGKVPPISKKHPYHALWIGIAPDKKILKRRIAARSRAMIRAGLIREIKKLLIAGVSKKRIREFGFEYGSALDVIEGKLAADEFAGILLRDTEKYAVCQMRWFKRNRDIHWIKTLPQAERLVKKFVKNLDL